MESETQKYYITRNRPLSKELLFRHRYAEAVTAYQNIIKEHPEKNYYGSLGNALLCCRRYEEALLNFERDNEISSSKVEGLFPSLIKVGVVQWLMDKQIDAIATWRRAAAGILDGTIHYGDLAGGGTQGLLLWYGATTIQNNEEKQFALNYLEELAKKKVYGNVINWPRPVILFVLKQLSLKETLKLSSGSSQLSDCLKVAKTDLLKRRRLCNVLFYSACQERENGNDKVCAQNMHLCYQLENPIIEPEWYLARGECEKR